MVAYGIAALLVAGITVILLLCKIKHVGLLMLTNQIDAYQLLRKLGAPERLILHVQLVGEAAELLMKTYAKLGVKFDAKLIELGVAIHDAGKIQHPQELSGPGSLHEQAGEELLLRHGVSPRVAKCCITHAAWKGPEVSLEERSVALADKLWKGKREVELELCVVDEIALQLGVGRWDIFQQLDSAFEEIAATGTERLHRSRSI